MIDSLLIENHDGILSLTMNRSQKKNALTDEMYEQLGQGFALALADSTVRVVLIKGNGADFSSGNDLQDLANWELCQSLVAPCSFPSPQAKCAPATTCCSANLLMGKLPTTWG